jgi:HAE1 family hydrophobic/amphiphilic exporter-1
VVRQNPAVEATFTMTGNGQFLASNQGLLLEFLKPPHERAPIQEVAGQLMGQIGAIPGVFPFLRPFPVLEISTGATNRNQGQYAFSVSGVNPDQVYDVSGKLMGKLKEYPGFQTVSSDYFHETPNLDIDIPRPGQDVRGLRDEDFGPLAKRLLAKLPLSHQKT